MQDLFTQWIQAQRTANEAARHVRQLEQKIAAEIVERVGLPGDDEPTRALWGPFLISVQYQPYESAGYRVAIEQLHRLD